MGLNLKKFFSRRTLERAIKVEVRRALSKYGITANSSYEDFIEALAAEISAQETRLTVLEMKLEELE